MGNKLKRQQRAKLKAKKNRLEKQKSKSTNNFDYVDDSPADNILTVSAEMVSVFKTLPVPDESFTYLPQLVDGLAGIFNLDEVQDLEALIASVSIQYVHWHTSGSDAMYESEFTELFDMIIELPSFQKQVKHIIPQHDIKEDFGPRRAEFEKDISARISKRLENTTFEHLSCGGSKMRFEMSLAINGYPFELGEGEDESDYQPLLNDSEYSSGIFDDIIDKVFLEAQKNYRDSE